MRLVTIDTESDGFVNEATRFWCGAAHVHGEDEVHRFDFTTRDDRGAFVSLLEGADVLLGHNLISHDLPLLARLWGVKLPLKRQKIVDTLLMSRLQRPERRVPPHCPRGVGPHSVEAWGYRLGERKQEHNEWDRYSPEMLERCVQDVRVQVRIYEALMEEGQGENWGAAHRLNHALFPLLHQQEQNGFAVDREHMERSVQRLTRWIDKIDGAVTPRLPVVVDVLEGKVKGEYGYVRKPFKKDGSYAAVTERFLTAYADDAVGYTTDDVSVGGQFCRVRFRYTDLGSNHEIKDFLIKSGWVPQQWNTNNDGKRTSPKLTQDETFEGVSGSLGKLIVKRVQCRQRRGVLEGWISYLDGLKPSSAVRLPGIVTGLAVTGRARHKLIVNVPGSSKFFGKEMRSSFVAPDGRVLVGIDSKGNQIRQLAARMGDDEFTSVVLDPSVDIHSYNQHRAGIATRHEAKTFFYALIFGAGDGKIARSLGISQTKAKQLRLDFLGGMPAMQELLTRLVAEWERSGGWIKGLDGRPIRVPGTHQLLVYLLQADEAIQMSHAYVLTHQRLVDDKLSSKFVLFMHDEFQLEAFPEEAARTGEIGCWAIKEAGERLGIPVAHDGEYKIGDSWYETH